MIKFKVTNPMQRGEVYYQMQKALKMAGYEDESWNIDGKNRGIWGERSQAAFEKMMSENGRADLSSVQIDVDIAYTDEQGNAKIALYEHGVDRQDNPGDGTICPDYEDMVKQLKPIKPGQPPENILASVCTNNSVYIKLITQA